MDVNVSSVEVTQGFLKATSLDSKTNQECWRDPIASPSSKGILKRGVGGNERSSSTRERS